MSADGDPHATGTIEDRPPEAAARKTAPRLTHQPGLDGLRGLAMLAIFVYHTGLDWIPGAFLSVSTFFTLSGFLITAVMLGEHGRSGRISLRRFWPRRLRRLLPASLLAIAAIVVVAEALADSTQSVRLGGDALASLFYVANWRFIRLGDSYGSLFESPSPFTHFWTLSIEEQFYLAFPVLLIGAVAVARGRHLVVGAILATVAAASVVWSIVLIRGGAATDRVYFGTDTRAAEMLAGAVLAVWWMRRNDPVRAVDRPGVRAVGVVALVAVLGLWATASLTQRFYYQGGLALYSLLTVAVILAVLQGGGVNRVLRLRPLVAVGVLSYGAYLFHWPILVWLDMHTGLPPIGRLVVGLPLTLALAALSYRYLERPVREGRLVRTPVAGWVAPAAVAAVCALVVATAGWRPAQETYDFAQALEDAESTGAPVDVEDMSPEQRDDLARFLELKDLRERLAASGAPSVATFGDSTALLNGLGLATWAETSFGDTGKATLVPRRGWSQLGCGLLSDSVRRQKDKVMQPPAECRAWWDSWAAAAAEQPPSLGVVMVGPWDVLDVKPAGFADWSAIGDPRVDRLIAQRIRTAIDSLEDHTDLVVLTLSPFVDMGRVDGRSRDTALVDSDPARMARFNELLVEAAAADPDVATLDLAGWLAGRPDEREMRPDGVHFTTEAAIEAGAWIGPELARLHAEWSAANP